MLLNQITTSNKKFSGNFGGAYTEDALAPSGVDERRLKDCIVSTLASVWGIPMMRLVQLEACFCLLHPPRPNSLMVVHQTGGGKTHILRTLGVIERGITLIKIPLLTLSACYAQVRCVESNMGKHQHVSPRQTLTAIVLCTRNYFTGAQR
jgi:hypothetical protein